MADDGEDYGGGWGLKQSLRCSFVQLGTFPSASAMSVANNKFAVQQGR